MPPVAEVQPVQSTSTGPKWPWIVLIVLFLLATGVGGFVLGKQMTKANLTTKVLPTPEPVLISDPTANWQTHTDSQLGISIRFPSTWSVSKTQNIEGVSTFWLTSNSPNKTSSTVKNLEIIIGSDMVYSTSGSSGIFANTASCGEPKEKPFSIEIENEVYTTSINGKACAGTGENTKFERYSFHFEKQGKLPYITGTYFTYDELEGIKQILPTLEFTDASNNSVKSLSYRVPAGWSTSQDVGANFQVGYNPATLTPMPQSSDKYLFFANKNHGSISAALKPYDGGSRHQFIYNQLNYSQSDVTTNTSKDYYEKEYNVDGKSCLIVYGLAYSASNNIWGMCAMSLTQAIFFSGLPTVSENEQFIQTFKLLK